LKISDTDLVFLPVSVFPMRVSVSVTELIHGLPDDHFNIWQWIVYTEWTSQKTKKSRFLLKRRVAGSSTALDTLPDTSVSVPARGRLQIYSCTYFYTSCTVRDVLSGTPARRLLLLGIITTYKPLSQSVGECSINQSINQSFICPQYNSNNE